MRFALSLLVFLMIPVICGAQATWYVPDDFPEGIQSAISDSTVLSGDTILVRPGTYVENIDYLNKNLSIISECGPEVTTIRGDKTESVVSIINYQNNTSKLAGFTIINGRGDGVPGNPGDCTGGGLTISYSSPIISNNIICNNTSRDGGGIYLEHSSSLILHNIIRDNGHHHINSSGGGIYIYNGSPSIINNIINDNESTANGGGIHTGGTETIATIINNLIYNNKALGKTSSGAGAGICISANTVIIKNNTIVNNEGNQCGGGVYSFVGDVYISNSILFNNYAYKGAELCVGHPTYSGDFTTVTIEYSNVLNDINSVFKDDNCYLNWKNGMISKDPIFTEGPFGAFYLSQAATGDPSQSVNSPCVDSGYPSQLSMISGTTRTDHVNDSDPVDIGFHYNSSMQGLPDLTSISLDVPSYCIENSSYSLTVNIYNNSYHPILDTFDVQFYSKGPSDVDWALFDTVNVTELLQYSNIDIATNWIPLESSQHNIKVIVDSLNVIDEYNELNNEIINSVNALSSISIKPSVQYDPFDESIFIQSLLRDHLTGEIITEPHGSVTWILVDSTGKPVPGFESHMPLSFNVINSYWEYSADLSGLSSGATFTAMIYYNLTYETPSEFIKDSDLAWINGYVTDSSGIGLENAFVEIYKVFDYFSPRAISTYQTYTNQDGYFQFDAIEPGTYVGTASYSSLLTCKKHVWVNSNEITAVDFKLFDQIENQFKSLLTPLAITSKETMYQMALDVSGMHNAYLDLVSTSMEEYLWDVADLCGSIMVGAASSAYSETIKILGVKSSQKYADTFIELLPYALARNVLSDVIISIINQGGKLIKSVLVSDSEIYPFHITEDNYYQYLEDIIDIRNSEFIVNPITLDPDFDYDRAVAVVEYMCNDLKSLINDNKVVIPFDYNNERDFLFYPAKKAFDNTYALIQHTSNTHKSLVVAKAAVGIIAIAGIPFTGGASLALIPVAAAMENIDFVVSTAETALLFDASLKYGPAIGNWIIDLAMLPSVFSDAVDGFLAESEHPDRFNKNKTHPIQIKTFNFTPDFIDPYTGSNIILIPWYGGIANNPVEIEIENLDQFNPVDAFVCINYLDDRLTSTIPSGESWSIKNGNYYYSVDPYNPLTTLFPRFFRVDVVAALPVSVTGVDYDYRYVDYYVLPDLFASKSINSNSLLPLSTISGQLTLSNTQDLYPTRNLIWDGYLNSNNPSVQFDYTVNTDSEVVSFCLNYPTRSIIQFTVIDQNGHKICHDYQNGFTRLEFPCEFSGIQTHPQIITIPDANGNTYSIIAEISMQYAESENHYISISALETPSRPAVLSVGSSSIECLGSKGFETDIQVSLGEAGGQFSLEDVEVTISPITYSGDTLYAEVSNQNIGYILPGSGTSASFSVDIPNDVVSGSYSGSITVTAFNAQPISIPITLVVSNPPLPPYIVNGPSTGDRNVSYDFEAISTDDDGDDIYYKFYWGDGDCSEWIGPYPSGDSCSISHSWSKSGKYEVEVIVKDIEGHLSQFSAPHEILIYGLYKPIKPEKYPILVD